MVRLGYVGLGYKLSGICYSYSLGYATVWVVSSLGLLQSGLYHNLGFGSLSYRQSGLHHFWHKASHG